MDIPKIGTIPSGLPKLKLQELFSFEWSNASMIFIPAITLAALGAIDSLLTSVIADNITKTSHNSNRELIGQGLGNMVSSIFGGIPGAGATMRTVVNVNSGGRTRISGVFHGILLLAILLGAGSFAAEIPLAVLAGILITVGIGIIDYKGLKHMAKIPRSDAVIMFIVLGVTVFVDLLQAVAIGMILATVLFMKKMGDTVSEKTKVGPIDEFAKDDTWADEQNISPEIAKKIYVKHLYGPLFFGFTSEFLELSNNITNANIVVIRMEKVPFIDQSGLYAVEDVILALRKKGAIVALTGLQSQPKNQLKKIKLIPNLISNEHLFSTFSQCKEWMSNELSSTKSKDLNPIS